MAHCNLQILTDIKQKSIIIQIWLILNHNGSKGFLLCVCVMDKLQDRGWLSFDSKGRPGCERQVQTPVKTLLVLPQG